MHVEANNSEKTNKVQESLLGGKLNIAGMGAWEGNKSGNTKNKALCSLNT